MASPEKPNDSRNMEDREPVGGQPQEPVEKRRNVGTVKPDDYPEDSRAKG